MKLDRYAHACGCSLRDKRDYHVPGAMPRDRGNQSKKFARVMRQRYQHRRDKQLTFHQSLDSSDPP